MYQTGFSQIQPSCPSKIWLYGRFRPEAELELVAPSCIKWQFCNYIFIIVYAVSTAISSPDYSQKSAHKKQITSRPDGGIGRTHVPLEAEDLTIGRYPLDSGIEISVLDLEGNFYGHVGSVDDFSLSAVPCGDVEDVLTYLMAEVIALNLHAGISNSLDTKLQAVFDTLTDLRGKNIKSAVKRMEAFIHEIEAQRGKHISEEDADHLLELAEAILEMIL